jgi:CheY-like chemotaxis protein
MLVDDSEADNFINAKILELSKFTEKIITKTSGKSALEYLKKHQDNQDKLPDVIFLDINMPVVNGYVFLYEFEKFSANVRNHCRVVILSSSQNPSDISRMITNSHVIRYVAKPLNLDTVKELREVTAISR